MRSSKQGRSSALHHLKEASRPLRPLKVAFDLTRYLKERARIVEDALAHAVPVADGPASKLFEAMRYSLLGGGKRLRPILTLASSEAVGGRISAALPFACAVEMIHTYSMVHDDLPCMDDDDLRRGRPANHKVYGDAIATLAGDALLTDAFAHLAINASHKAPPAVLAQAVSELAQAAGSAGMVSGQVIDILSEGQPTDLGGLEYLHSKKTGALFIAAVRGGAIFGGADPSQLESLTAYARSLGLAFQVIDDVLDVEAPTERMGKRTRKDHTRAKATYPSLMGLEPSKEFARDLERRAIGALSGFGHPADALREIARFVVERDL